MHSLSQSTREGWDPLTLRLLSGAETSGGSRNVYQPIANGINHEFGGLVYSQRIHDIGAMHGNGIHAEVKLRGNLFIRFAIADQLQDLDFACCQPRIPFAFQVFFGRKGRIEHGLPIHDAAYRRSQLEVNRVLEHVTARARIHRLAHPGVFGVHAEHKNKSVGRKCQNLSCRLQAVDLRQRTVHDHYLGFKRARELNGFFAIAGFANDANVRLILEHATESAPDQAVIVHQQHRNFFRHATPGFLALRFLWELSAVPACRAHLDFRKKWRRPAIPRAPAWPPSPAPIAHAWLQSLIPGPQLLAQADPPRSSGAPRLVSRRSAAQHYSRLPAARDTRARRSCQ